MASGYFELATLVVKTYKILALSHQMEVKSILLLHRKLIVTLKGKQYKNMSYNFWLISLENLNPISSSLGYSTF